MALCEKLNYIGIYCQVVSPLIENSIHKCFDAA